MANYEEQMRREMEAAAKEQQCPVEGDIDVALSLPKSHSSARLKAKKINEAQLKKDVAKGRAMLPAKGKARK